MDFNHDGVLSIVEFKKGLRILLGSKLSNGQMYSLMELIDTDGSQDISYAEFVAVFERAAKARCAGDSCSTRYGLTTDITLCL